MKVEVRLAQLSERMIVRNLMELYQHDFSELDGTDLDCYGQYGYYDLDCFLISQGWSAYVIKVDDRWAGFALTNDEVQLNENTFSIVEFFVVRKYRRHGIGKLAALQIMSCRMGKWEVRVTRENNVALLFWESLLETAWPDSYHSAFVNSQDWHGTIFSVEVRNP